MYKYELHLHTQETSICGHVPAAEQVRRYKALGYDGVAITDHFHGEYVKFFGFQNDWQGMVDRAVLGYNEAKKEGDKIGLHVIFGVELRFPGDERDYVTYGIDEKWLRNHPFCCNISHQEFFDRYKDELLFIQAHPYRGYDEQDPAHVHGIEVVNGNPRQINRNELALELAKDNPHLIVSVGSDCHRDEDGGTTAVLFEKEIKNGQELREEMMAGRYDLWSPANENIINEAKGLIHHV